MPQGHQRYKMLLRECTRVSYRLRRFPTGNCSNQALFFPVGKINFIQIDPMTFSEFLLANSGADVDGGARCCRHAAEILSGFNMQTHETGELKTISSPVFSIYSFLRPFLTWLWSADLCRTRFYLILEQLLIPFLMKF